MTKVRHRSNKHWLPWLQRQLILKGILTQTPELPEPYEPVYEKWSAVFEQFVIDEDTMLIGHSCGGGFLVRWLSENKIKVGKVALIAPFIAPNKDEMKSDFFNFEIDEKLIERTSDLAIFVSADDDQEILISVDQIRSKIREMKVMEFTNKGHFTLGDMKTEEFPELLEFLLS